MVVPSHWDQAQNKINREMRAFKLLGIIKSFPLDTIWTNKRLSKLSRIDVSTVQTITWSLVSVGYLNTYRGIYRITDKGLDFYDSAKSKPWFDAFREWRNEALSGITNAGEQSQIDNAILPKSGGRTYGDKSPEDIYSHYESDMRMRQRVARELNISIAEYDERIRDGSIHVCKGIDFDNEGELIQHLGIFDRHKQGWQHLCRKCRKRLRKNK